MDAVESFEKLGVFYLGKSYDIEKKASLEDLILYDSKDLTTHAVIIGMTGSGKTGLGIGMIEEAAMDRIPVIAIDPKGDLANLMFTFPDLSDENFRQCVNEGDAAAKGMTLDAFASAQAELWRKGLKEWGQSGERIRKLKETADFSVYTPGSSAGLQISVLRSFRAPPREFQDDRDLYRERITATASSLLSLLGIEADPMTSREHILISNILFHSWDKGMDLDLHSLIQAIQSPPFKQIGVMNTESFFPSKERFELSIRFNALLASPGFEAWREGDPLDIGNMLYTETGKPKVSIMSIAHLSDPERMFFVSMILNELIGWMRSQPGTSSLRAILYIDELFGYMPPVASPPSKIQLLTLLKQARAFGLGVVLATQNPVDLDYKGLSNAGTWFIGRLQTERDKARLMDGLEGIQGGKGFDRKRIDRILTSLGKRIFLLHNVNDNEPAVFQTRWTMSYLSGPLTREQIKKLMTGRTQDADRPLKKKDEIPVPSSLSEESGDRPIIPSGVRQYFIPPSSSPEAGSRVYYPRAAGACEIGYENIRYGLQYSVRRLYLCDIQEGPVSVDWEQSETIEMDFSRLEASPVPESAFASLPPSAGEVKSYTEWGKLLEHWIRLNEGVHLFRNPEFSLVSKPGESEKDFRVRLQQSAREKRDEEIDALRKKYAAKIQTLNDQIRRAEHATERETAQSTQRKVDTAISVGAVLLGAFLGRKGPNLTSVSKAGTAARQASRLGKEAQDVQRAKETETVLRERLAQMRTDPASDWSDWHSWNRNWNSRYGRSAKWMPQRSLSILSLCSRRALEYISISWVLSGSRMSGIKTIIW